MKENSESSGLPWHKESSHISWHVFLLCLGEAEGRNCLVGSAGLTVGLDEELEVFSNLDNAVILSRESGGVWRSLSLSWLSGLLCRLGWGKTQKKQPGLGNFSLNPD